MKLKEIAELWIEDKRPFVKPQTFDTYYHQLYCNIIPHFGENEVVTSEQMQKYILEAIKIRAYHSVRDTIVVLKQILKFGVKNKYLEVMPEIELRYPSRERGQKLPLIPIADQDSIISYVRSNISPVNFQIIGLWICLTTGIRLGEVCGIQWGDVDFDRGVISINKTITRHYDRERRRTRVVASTTKTSSSFRDVPIVADILEVLKKYRPIILSDNWYLLTFSTEPTEPTAFRKAAYYATLKKLNIQPVNPHGMRHSFASRCIAAGADVKTTSTILGHSDVSITLNTYVHPTMEQKKAIVDNIFGGI